MRIEVREIIILKTRNGLFPFEDWFRRLKDRALTNLVDIRINRIKNGNFGDHKSLGRGVFELRIMKGAGLRIYYGIDSKNRIVLILGGNKSSQKKDIILSKKLWKEYLNEK